MHQTMIERQYRGLFGKVRECNAERVAILTVVVLESCLCFVRRKHIVTPQVYGAFRSCEGYMRQLW